MSHLILLGDSVFDNAAYTDGGPDVVTQLNEALPAGWAASLLAIDGSITGDIAVQVGCLPSDATHLALSVGGNDAILRTTIAHRLPVIDLRAICTNPEDYANAIEPSSVGGAKIARAIAALATGTDPYAGATHIIAR
jgi:hypothetical protein